MTTEHDKFKFEVVEKDHSKTILLSGVIDEDTNFTPILKFTDAPLVFNFKDVASINSCGIRTWVNFLKELGPTETHYEMCTPLIVRQMNMVPSFLGKAHVNSVYVPYVCEECDTEKEILVNEDKFKKGLVTIAETIPCESCGKGEMELDGHPKQYFAFAK